MLPPSLSLSQRPSWICLTLWNCFEFQGDFFLSPLFLWHFDLKHSDWRYQLLCALLCVWYGVGHVWVFLCGIYLVSNLTALHCVTQRGLCLHTSDDDQGTGLSGPSYITGAGCFQSLLNSCESFSPQRPPVLDERTGQSMLACNPLSTAIMVWGTISPSVSYKAVCV